VLTHEQSVIARMLSVLADPAGTVSTPPRELVAKCPGACEGTGEVGCASCRGSGLGIFSDSCAACAGDGTKRCSTCKGTGEVKPAHIVPALACACGEFLAVPAPRQLAAWIDEHAKCGAAS
jgi:hypothetical protein